MVFDFEYHLQDLICIIGQFLVLGCLSAVWASIGHAETTMTHIPERSLSDLFAGAAMVFMYSLVSPIKSFLPSKDLLSTKHAVNQS